MKTIELLKAFMNAYFMEHNPEKCLVLVTDDIKCYGFADTQELTGIKDLRKMAVSEAHSRFMAAELEIEKEEQISDDNAVLRYSLSLNSVTMHGRIAGNSRQTPKGNRLYFINNAALNPLQTLNAFEYAARTKRAEKARGLLKEAIHGGLMGCYLEPGFPLYFINDNMLHCLGYNSEDELIRNTQGMIENCIYAEDRELIDKLVFEQVSDAEKYEVEYRILKKDGSFIWVHEVGQKSLSEDGRNVILSTCFDITSEKNHEHFLEGLVTGLNGDLALLAVDLEQMRTIPIYVSESMGKQEGITREEYLKRYYANGMDSIYSGDYQRVWDAICEAVRNDAAPSVSFRVIDENKKQKWMNVSFARHGEKDGLPVILALFTESTIQNDLQLHALSQNSTGIAVIDVDTHEVYFANEAIFHMLGNEPIDYTNKLCIEILAGCGGSCENCGMDKIQKHSTLDKTVEFNGKWLFLHAERREWTDKSVISIYVTDVTEKTRLQKQMEDLFENIPSAVCLYRWNGSNFERILVGKGFQSLFGNKAKALVDSSQSIIYEIVHPDDVQDLKKHIFAFRNRTENESKAYQYRAWNDDRQEYIWVSIHANKVKQSDGTYLLYVVFTNDMEQVELKNQLAGTRTAINAAVQYGQIGLWTYDLSTQSILQNISDVASYGYGGNDNYSPKLFVSRKVIHEEDAEAYLSCYQEIHDGAKNSDCIARVFDDNRKEYRWLHIYLVRQPDGQHTSTVAIGMSFDITGEITNYKKLAKTQKQLQQEKHVVDDLFENLPGGVVMYRWKDKKFQPLYASNSFSGFYGENGKTMLMRDGSILFDLVHPDDLPALQEFIACNIENDGQNLIYRYRVFSKHKNEYMWVQLTGKVARQSDGTSIVYANYANVDAEVKAAQEIQKEEELLEKTCQLAHIWMLHYNLKTKRIRVSKGLQADYHVPAVVDNFPDGFFAYPVVPKEYHALYRQMIQKVDDGEDATTEMQVQMPDGTHRYVRFEWHVTGQENGETVEVVGLSLDITSEVAERRRIENERQKLLDRDKKLCAYSITDLQKEIIMEAKDISLGSGIHSGDTCKDFEDKVAKLLLTKEDRQHFLKMRDSNYVIRQFEAGKTEWVFDMYWKVKNGQICQLRSVYSIIENINTGELYLYCYLYDITEERIAHALFAGIQENLYLKTGVLSYATGKLYIYRGKFPNQNLISSDYNYNIQGYVRDEVFSEDVDKVLEQISIPNIKKQLAVNPKGFSFVHRIMENGSIHHRQVWYVPVPGEPDYNVIVIRDVTDLIEESERRNAELKKALTAANAAALAKSEFLSRMSHEIRTPMNAIMGMTAIAQDNKYDYLQVSDCLSKIDVSSHYLLTLINDILEMSRIESGRTKLSEDKFDFAELIEQISTVSEPLAKMSKINLEITNRTSNGIYYGDYIRIQQVMINLLGNAVKFTKPSGRVRFDVCVNEETETKTVFEFTVEDTGIGMSKEFMNMMFEPFTQEDATTTSQYGGSGLGLAISKNLIDAMGGTVAVESTVGIGTKFTVEIPLKKSKSTILQKIDEVTEIPEAEQDAILQGKNILMAEDHPINVMVTKKLLERKGIIITVAENGKIAVETFRTSEPNEYDAVLMDIRMPIMDGLEATRQIRALDRPDAKEVPIIAMTANAMEEDCKNSKAAGMNEHLAKPIDPKMMYQILAEQISKRNSG